MSQLQNRILSDVRELAAELWRDGRGWILLTVAAGWFLSLGVRLIYPALVPFFQTEFHLSLTAAGLLLSVLWGAYAIGQLPGGILGDRLGEGRILVYSTALSSGAILVVAISMNVWMLLVGTIVFGLATALYGPTRFTIFTDIYSDRAGSAIGLTMAAGSAGNVLLPIVATSVSAYATWRLSFGVFVPLFVVVTAALAVVVPRRTSETMSKVNSFSVETLRQIVSGLRSGMVPTVATIQTFETFVFQGFVSFFPTYLALEKGLSPTRAAMLYALFFGTSLLVQPLTGTATDRFGPKWTLTAVQGVSLTGLMMLPFVDDLILLVVLTALISMLSGTAVVTHAYIADELPSGMKGTGLGTIRTMFILLGATSPVIAGSLADAGFFDEVFLLLAGCLGVGVLITLVRL